MAYLTVTTPFDVVAPGDGKLSLREALIQANGSGGPDTIRFSAIVVGQTLVLTGGELTITDNVTIDGRGGCPDHDRRGQGQPGAEYHGWQDRGDAERLGDHEWAHQLGAWRWNIPWQPSRPHANRLRGLLQ